MALADTGSFQHEQAPCGRVVDCQCHDDRDDEGLIIHDLFYACGCRSMRHEYHDGSLSRKIVHHNGHVLVDELIAEH
jgi:hypothetical protein